MKLGIEELSIIVEGLRLRVKQLSSSVTEINQSIENLETEDGQKAPAIMQTTSPAAIASFSDGGEDMPIKSLKCTIVPVQAGTGDPAPDNIRPITGWNGVTVTRTGTDPADTVSKSVNFPSTVYGGWVDVVKGELHVTHGIITDMGNLNWSKYNDYGTNTYYLRIEGMDTTRAGLICSIFKTNNAWQPLNAQDNCSIQSHPTLNNVYVLDNAIDTTADFKTAVTGQTLVYELASEQVIQIDPVTMTTLLGNNNVYCDTGKVEVEYAADTKMYIDNAVTSVTPEPEEEEVPPEEEEEEEAEPAPEEDIAVPAEAVEEEAEPAEAVEEEAEPVVKKTTRKK